MLSVIAQPSGKMGVVTVAWFTANVQLMILVKAFSLSIEKFVSIQLNIENIG